MVPELQSMCMPPQSVPLQSVPPQNVLPQSVPPKSMPPQSIPLQNLPPPTTLPSMLVDARSLEMALLNKRAELEECDLRIEHIRAALAQREDVLADPIPRQLAMRAHAHRSENASYLFLHSNDGRKASSGTDE